MFQGQSCSHFRSFTMPGNELVIGVNVRRNQPQGSNVGLNVRLSNEPSRLYYSGGGRFKAMNGNLFCIFSTEKYPVIRKRGRQVEVVSKFHPKFFGLNVRRHGPPPSICVRSFSPITTNGNSSYIFSAEKCTFIIKYSKVWKWCRTFSANFFDLNVRHLTCLRSFCVEHSGQLPTDLRRW